MARELYSKSSHEANFISTEDAKEWCRVTHSKEDELFGQLIASVIDFAEEYLWRGLGVSTWVLERDCFDNEIQLTKNPVNGITSIQYYDESNTQQTLSASEYELFKGVPAEVLIESPPATYGRVDAVRIEFQSGDATPPMFIKTKLLNLILLMYSNRGDEDVMHLDDGFLTKAKHMLAPFRFNYF